MQVNLTKPELEMLEKALDVYEREAGQSAFMTGMLGMMLSPKEERASEKDKLTLEMHKAEDEMRQRRIASTLLRAKLYQVAALESEHVLS